MLYGSHAPSQDRQRLGTVLILAVVAVLVAGVLWVVGDQRGWFVGSTGSAGSPASPTVEQPLSRRAGLEEVLQVRAGAMRDKDRAGWLSRLDPANTELQQAQATLFDNMAEVSFDLVEYAYTGESPLPAERRTALGPDAWVAKVNISYRIAGADTASVRREQFVTMVLRGRTWYIAGFGDHPADAHPVRDLWELTPVTVTRGSRSLILSTNAEPQQRMAARVDRGAEHVDRVWGVDWPRTVVVVVPTDQEQMAQLLGRTDQAGLDQIAAVTTGEVGLTDTGVGADRIILNPHGFAQLDAAAAQMVMTHEIAHVAARSGGGGEVPIWLSEGLADYVAFKDSKLSTWQRAGDVLDQVRRGNVPTRLPDLEAFDPAVGDVAPAYSASYLAVTMLVERYGEAKVLQLYRTVQGSDTRDGATAAAVPMDAAMRDVLGITEAQFEQDWIAYLHATAGG